MPFEDSSSSSSDAISKMKQRLSGFETEKGRLSGLNYQPKTADEIIITTTPKAGTTWMQQICHQLRSGPDGDMDFIEISEVVPWLELAYDQGQDLNATQYGDDDGIPRIFKSHAWYDHCPKGCKVIVVIRDPMDVVMSFYNFFEDWFFERGQVSLEEFAHEFWLSRGVPTSKMNNASYFVHLISWYQHRNDRNVLFVCFEDLKEDLEKQVRRVAEFMSTDKHDFTKEEYIQGAVERSSFVFMKEHSSQFDEKLSKLARNEACGLPKDAGMNGGKLREGASGGAKTLLSPSLQERICAKWNEVVTPVTGCDTYAELRASLDEEQ